MTTTSFRGISIGQLDDRAAAARFIEAIVRQVSLIEAVALDVKDHAQALRTMSAATANRVRSNSLVRMAQAKDAAYALMMERVGTLRRFQDTLTEASTGSTADEFHARLAAQRTLLYAVGLRRVAESLYGHRDVGMAAKSQAIMSRILTYPEPPTELSMAIVQLGGQ